MVDPVDHIADIVQIARDLPKLDLTRLRIAFAPTFPGLPVAREIRQAIELLAQQLDRAGALVEAAATALGIRGAAIHSLPANSTLGPGRVLPSGRDLPIPIRRRLARICLDVWSQAQTFRRPTALSSPHLLKHA